MIKTIFSLDFTLTKRHIGLIALVAGIAGLAVTLAAEWITAQPGGFGTVQKMGLALSLASIAVGLTLVPLGSQPA